MTNANVISGIQQAGGIALNNANPDPIQGFDVDVFTVDQATGQSLLVGSFTSAQITVRNATEPYLELNQRSPRYLDGEIQIGWVLERGMLDSRIIQQTFGISALTREIQFGRSPRLQIELNINAAELDKLKGSNSFVSLQNNTINNGGEVTVATPSDNFNSRRASGRLRLTFCKVDSLTMGVMSGRNVVANRWEGLAEGIEEVEGSISVQGFEDTVTVSAEDAINQAASVFNSLINAGSASGIDAQ